MGRVVVIPSTINAFTQAPYGEEVKRRVCAYARVSTDTDEQYTSYQAQCTYYKEYIQNHGNWEFIGVFADEGITGTSTRRRAQFNEMIERAYNGEIDLIVTKSISRFARNTVDTISITRKLKRKGVEVFFEKENIWSLEDSAEFILTILASVAQEESRSISMNVKMGRRWAMQEGRGTWAYSSLLGFKKGLNGAEIIEEEAKVVRSIYRMFLVDGRSYVSIARKLNSQNIPTPQKGLKGWTSNNIHSILTNEKYKGDMLLQKSYVEDYLNHKVVKNNGELPKYHVKNSHPYIIDPEEWELVQVAIEERDSIGRTYFINPFRGKVVCCDCGSMFGRKVLTNYDCSKKECMMCNGKYDKRHEQCQTPKLTVEEIQRQFIHAYNKMMVDREQTIKDLEEVIEEINKDTSIDDEVDTLTKKLEELNTKLREMVRENSTKEQNQEEYMKKYDEVTQEQWRINQRLDDARKRQERRTRKIAKIRYFIKHEKEYPEELLDWDEKIWNLFIDKAVVKHDGSIVFKFRNGVVVRG